MMHTLAVKLAADIIYVIGTVNGEEVTWTHLQGLIWQAIVQRSPDGRYDIVVTGYDELGRTTEYRTVLRYGFEAVTNRRAGAYYNATDLNRVERATQYLADMLSGYGYHLDITTKEWVRTDFPTPSALSHYLVNIKKLMDIFAVLPTTPPLPDSLERLGYEGANAIEQILVDMHYLILQLVAAFIYSGEIQSGEV